MKRIVLAAILAIGLVQSSWAASNPDGVAVIIGNKVYEGRIPPVDYAYNDAEAIKRYIIDVLGFDVDNIIDLRDATQAQMQSAFGNERDHKGKLWSYLEPKGRSDVVVFYSGHGVPGQRDKRGYLLPVNADADTPEINGYPIDVLYANLLKLKTRSITVLIDACFSGDSHRGMLIRAASPVHLKAKLPEIGDNMTVLTAASGSQLASWDEKSGHGLFTEHLLRGLYGGADEDKNGQVTAAEVKAYLDQHMTRSARREYRREQVAMVLGDRERVLAAFRPGKAPKRPRLAAKAPAAPPAEDQEALFWQSIKDSQNVADYEAYVARFPKGTFAPLARNRIAGLKRAQVAVVTPPKPEPVPRAAPPALEPDVLPEGTIEDQYRFAFLLLRDARYDDAEVALRAFLEAHGSDALAGNARYWLGETYYVRGYYQQAAVVFYEGYNGTPKGPTAADNLLKLGMSLARSDKKKEACATFGKLTKEFPDVHADIAKLVTRERQRTGC